jgi:predicted small lipoprotein YifL
MKKVLSIFAIVAMIVGLTGCMDNPDGSKQKVSSVESSSRVA